MRNFWLPELHKVTGPAKDSFSSWITKGDFVFTSLTSSSKFTIKVLTPEAGLAALAHDCNKMASASFETFLELSKSQTLPKSCAWVNLSTYYGSFFAAHAILRLCGTICFQVDSQQKIALEKTADAFGILPPKGIDGGFYVGSFDSSSNEINFEKTSAGSSGSHNVMWNLFNDALKRFSAELLKASALHTESSDFLLRVSSSLCRTGNTGSWLSSMRNDINYKLAYGAWFPYKDLKTKKSDLLTIASKWKKEPTQIQILYPNDILSQQVATSTALVSLCRLLVLDMMSGTGSKSFHSYGSVALLKQAKSL